MGLRPAPLLVLGVGNPSRGDDAVGPLFIERASDALRDDVARGEIELLTDFQLQIEHALDLDGRRRVVFVDASVRAAAPFRYARLTTSGAPLHSTHAMCPEQVLDTYRRIRGEPPEAWVLEIRGDRFELGDPPSAHAAGNLDAALEFFLAEARRPPPHGEPDGPSGRRLELAGTVQGVGLRPWVYRAAERLGLTGAVWNTPGGVIIEAFGPRARLDALVRELQEHAPGAARLRSSTIPWREERGFTIGPSEAAGARALVLPPDLAPCAACLRELDDAADRHHGYAFTSCTECGPRFAIARALPFDRATTTMASFPLCAACRAEYERPEDRRFHAEATACPACGPRVWLADARGEELPHADPIGAAASALLDGKILGVRGIGAFHLVCDATDPSAVALLRQRKRRDAQPLAVMVAGLPEAEAIATLDPPLRDALTSAARPIVLAPGRPGALAPGVNGPSARTGVMLPYTPLLHRLAAQVARPLVVTSANPSGGPAVIDHRAADARLADLVDGLLLHDRPIARRVEDSVVAASAAGVRVLRRSRGLVPAPIRLPAPSPEVVLAVGGHTKNTACLVIGDLAYLTPHLGDLGTVEGETAWARDVEGLEALLGVRAAVIAHDLHPDYTPTRYALARPARRRVGVQHHAAHAWATIAELHLAEPVVAVVLDGSGFGPDGTSWGGELLLVDGPRWTRIASFRPLPLPGGERAIREVWRVALAALGEAFGASEALALARGLPVFAGQTERERATVLEMIARGVSTPRARGVGRWFDAVGALVLSEPRAAFDGHVAIALEEAAEAGEVPAYAVGLPTELALADGLAVGPEHEVDLRPTIRAVIADGLAGVSSSRIAARFQQTVVEAAAAVVARALAATGLRSVVLSGGCLQNRALERGLRARLGDERVFMARDVPLNDGGLSLGQAWAAVLALRAELEEVKSCA